MSKRGVNIHFPSRVSIEFPYFALAQPCRAFDSIKDRVKTPVLGHRTLVSYVPLCFYSSESASCWNKRTAGLRQCKVRKLRYENMSKLIVARYRDLLYNVKKF